TEGGLVPDEPHHHDGGYGPQNNGGEAADTGDNHGGDRGVDGTEGHTLGGVGHQTEDYQHVGHGGNEGVHLELGGKEACNGGEHGTKDDAHQQRQEHPGQDRQGGKVK